MTQTLPWLLVALAGCARAESISNRPVDASAELTELDLSDDWVPRVLAGEGSLPGPAYAATFVALAGEQLGDGDEWSYARVDRYYELFGIPPSPSVVLSRLDDGERHACHDAVDDTALDDYGGPLAPDGRTPAASRRVPLRIAAVLAVERHLVCERLLTAKAADGRFDGQTQAAIAIFRRRAANPATSAALDADTIALLVTDSRELDFQTGLRVLRERVVDATGLIEDGSASASWGTVLGRTLDAPMLRDPGRTRRLEDGAADWIAPATEAAARALGWTSPEAMRRSLASGNATARWQVKVALPPLPPYHGPHMDLRAEIDRGEDPTLVLYARDGDRDVALVRWPTTIGGWQRERLPGGGVVRRYKASPTGDFVWRDLLAAPVWFPPPSTPHQELVRRSGRRWVAREDTIGPGYRSAYGLAMIMHHREVRGRSGQIAYRDSGVRTHGTVSYASVLEDGSHGCHRLHSRNANRLASFLLGHRAHVTHGDILSAYSRRVVWRGHVFDIRRGSHGYRYELTPPVPVRVSDQALGTAALLVSAPAHDLGKPAQLVDDLFEQIVVGQDADQRSGLVHDWHPPHAE